ncbi:MAG: hypothetical protein J0L69_07680 [Bacteroidetes bacterium]|nr:hypothetical protein [Bacteroidota bacterium]
MTYNDEIDSFLKERFKVYDATSKLQQKIYKNLIDELSAGNEIREQGYKYLCWLNFHDMSVYPVEINKPIVPNVLMLSAEEFKNRFCTNGKRNEIYEHFLGYVKARMEEFQVNTLNVLIGGSFVEAENTAPNDIDCMIIVNREQLKRIVANDYDSYCVRKCLPVDVEFAIEDLTYKDYWYYSCLTHLGNKPKDKGSEWLRNNEFNERKVFLVAMSYESN